MQCTFKVTLRRVRVAIVAVGKSIRITYSDVCPYSCLSHPACKEHVPHYTVFCGLSGSAVFTLSQNGTSFGNTAEHKMCVCSFLQGSLKNFSFQEKFSDILLQMQQGLLIKYPLPFSDFIPNAARSSYKVPLTLFRF